MTLSIHNGDLNAKNGCQLSADQLRRMVRTRHAVHTGSLSTLIEKQAKLRSRWQEKTVHGEVQIRKGYGTLPSWEVLIKVESAGTAEGRRRLIRLASILR